ncbi:MAG: leucine-rich repeat protein [Clostridia bacterium]|nr:leucine-rich repeat protein [Clostridia bacterium]
MKKDFDIIKKKYGENFAKMCRTYFPTILQDEGVLPRILEEHFAPTKSLFDDIIENHAEESFKSYIYNFYSNNKVDYTTEVLETPEQLMKKAGYTLYKCETDEDVKSFMKYFEEDEELCTFKDEDRINTHTIFFAVKDNVEGIRRENFSNPKRQDEYGTSVISIQFTKGDQSTLSIKNRYNHTVDHPDATFSNDLENIIAGLTDSFRKHYGIKLLSGKNKLDLPYYVQGDDDKYYRYNYEIANNYFCENNIIVDGIREVHSYDKSRYELIDYFLIDKQDKNITVIGSRITEDSLPSFITRGQEDNISSIDVCYNEDKSKKIITVTRHDKTQTVITTNKHNQMIGLSDDNITKTPEHCVVKGEYLEKLELPNCEIIGMENFRNAKRLKHVNLPKTKYISLCSFENVSELKELSLPSIENIDDQCFITAWKLTSLHMPNLKTIGTCFYNVPNLNVIKLHKLVSLEPEAFKHCESAVSIELPELECIEAYSFQKTPCIKKLNLPKIKWINNDSFKCATNLEELYLDSCKFIGGNCFTDTHNLTSIYAPLLEKTIYPSFNNLKSLQYLYIPSLNISTCGFIHSEPSISKLKYLNYKHSDYPYLVDKVAKDGIFENIKAIDKEQFQESIIEM